MSNTLTEAERRLRWGIPLRLDQVTDLMQEGVDASVVESRIEQEQEGGGKEETCQTCGFLLDPYTGMCPCDFE